jgi:hypothetical protein
MGLLPKSYALAGVAEFPLQGGGSAYRVNAAFTVVRDLERPMTRVFGMSTRREFRALERGAVEARTAAALILGILLLRRP